MIGRSDDALRALALVYPALLAFVIAWALWLRSAMTRRRLESRRSEVDNAPLRRAGLNDRVAASSIDATVVLVSLVTPSTMLSRAHLEVVALVSVLIAATAYFAATTARDRGTIGQRALRLVRPDCVG